MRNAIAACAALLLGASAAAAETYPSRRITAIVPFAAGSGTDSVARIVSQKLSEVLKTTIVIDNRGGANGTGERSADGDSHLAVAAACRRQARHRRGIRRTHASPSKCSQDRAAPNDPHRTGGYILLHAGCAAA